MPRLDWGATRPETVRYIPLPVPDVVVHHTASAACASEAECARAVRNMQAFHMDSLHYGDIAYGFLIGGDGTIIEGRGWHKAGAHTLGYNTRSIGVAFIGTYSDTPASEKQISALGELLRCGVQLGELSGEVRLYGARQVQATESPGFALARQLREFSQWIEKP